MEPKAFLDLAANLKDGNNEASWRTSVSRSYYALFNWAAQFIRQNTPVVLSRDAKVHEDIYYYLNNCGVEDVKDVASSLNYLRDIRNDADYKLDSDRFDGNCANLAFIQARNAIKEFEKAAGNAKGRQTIIEGIKSYNSKLQRPTA